MKRKSVPAKTHCKNGHAFTPENTRINKQGRKCRACERERQRAVRNPVAAPQPITLVPRAKSQAHLHLVAPPRRPVLPPVVLDFWRKHEPPIDAPLATWKRWIAFLGAALDLQDDDEGDWQHTDSRQRG